MEGGCACLQCAYACIRPAMVSDSTCIFPLLRFPSLSRISRTYPCARFLMFTPSCSVTGQILGDTNSLKSFPSQNQIRSLDFISNRNHSRSTRLNLGVHAQGAMEGGFMGRTNKLVDGCYSFWQAAIFPLLQTLQPELLRQTGNPCPPRALLRTALHTLVSLAVAPARLAGGAIHRVSSFARGAGGHRRDPGKKDNSLAGAETNAAAEGRKKTARKWQASDVVIPDLPSAVAVPSIEQATDEEDKLFARVRPV